MLRVYLLANAPTPAQRALRFPADEGIEPIRPDVAQRALTPVRSYDAAWCGPERQSAETATALGVAAESCPDLRAWSAGAWAGQSVAWIAEHDPDGFQAWRTDPAAAPAGGESLNGLLERVADWLETQTQPSARLLVVADAAVIRAAVVHALDTGPRTFWRLDVSPLSLTIVQRAGREWRLRSLGLEPGAALGVAEPPDSGAPLDA